MKKKKKIPAFIACFYTTLMLLPRIQSTLIKKNFCVFFYERKENNEKRGFCNHTNVFKTLQPFKKYPLFNDTSKFKFVFCS